MLIQTFIRKLLRLKAHTVTQVTQVEMGETEIVVTIDRMGSRMLQCSVCGKHCRKSHGLPRPERNWRDLSMRDRKMVLRYRPRRVNCPNSVIGRR